MFSRTPFFLALLGMLVRCLIHANAFNIMINTFSWTFFHGNMEMGIREKNAEAGAEGVRAFVCGIWTRHHSSCHKQCRCHEGSWSIIEGRYPGVTWLPCSTHQADLMMKKIAKLEYFQEAVTQVRGVCV
jgi:hypothetical protein